LPPCFGAAVDAGRANCGVLLRRDNAAVADGGSGAQRGVAPGIDRAAVVQAGLGRQLHRLGGADGTAVAYCAVGIDHHIPGAGTDSPGVMHADPGLGAQQADLIGIHAAQRCHVDRHLRVRAAVVRFARRILIGGIDAVAPGGDGEVFGPQPGVDFYRAGDEIGMVLQAAVHAVALNDDFAAIDVITAQLAVIHFHLAGGQDSAVGIDKAAAAAGNARRVSDHHLGFLPGDFDKAVKLAGVA